MATNSTLEIGGSYKDEEGVTQKFTCSYTGYTEDSEGHELLTEDYGSARIVATINKPRSTQAVNAERQRLTAGVREANKEKANIVDELKAADSAEDKLRILERYGMA